MKLDSRIPEVSRPLHLHYQNWSGTSDDLATADSELQASTWVQLLELPSPYSHDEALLLCQHSETEWIAWVPEYGEMILHRHQFRQPN
jgi:hypothetical protein